MHAAHNSSCSASSSSGSGGRARAWCVRMRSSSGMPLRRAPLIAAAAAAAVAARAPLPPKRGTIAAAAAGAAPAGAAADAAQQQRDIALLLDVTRPPVPYVGPVRVARYVGTGRGLEATRTLAAGELVLVCEPLAFVEQSAGGSDADADDDDGGGGAAAARSGAGSDDDDEGAADDGDDGASDAASGGGGGAYVPTDDDVDALVAQLEAAASSDPRAAAWLAALDDGRHAADAPLPDLAQLASVAAGGGSDVAAAAGSSAQPSPSPRSPDELADIVDVNFWSVREDAAAAVLRGGEVEGRNEGLAAPRDLVGVWPAAALLNHSCAPNASVVGVGGRLAVRAARAVPKQMELAASYLSGAQLLAPLVERRAALREARGFECRCARCRDEGRLDPQMARLVGEVAGACRALEADLADAVMAGSARAAERIGDQLAAYVELVDAAFNKLALPGRTQTYVQASLFRLYALTALATSAAGNEQPRLVELLAALAGEVAPGSEEHTYWARRYRAVVDEVEGEDGRFDGALRQADGVCYAAHAARYGALPPALYRKLLAAAEEAEAADAGWEDEDEYEEDDDESVIQIQ